MQLFQEKKTQEQVFSSKFSEIFKILFVEHARADASLK